jgi:hypothetical protein
VIVKQVLGLSPEEPVTARILEDFLAFMKGLISFPLYIPGTPYAKAVQVIIQHVFISTCHACINKGHRSISSLVYTLYAYISSKEYSI